MVSSARIHWVRAVFGGLLAEVAVFANRGSIEERTTTWDKAIVERTTELSSWSIIATRSSMHAVISARKATALQHTKALLRKSAGGG
jgi:hypothetical protein